MQSDKYGNPIFQDNDIIDLIYKGHIDQLDQIIVNETVGIKQLAEYSEINLKLNQNFDIEVADFDKICQSDWFMPEEYKKLDIEEILVTLCPKENYQRLIEELEEFRERNMLDLLRVLKYTVDTLKTNSIVWGVGRGSSVASYVNVTAPKFVRIVGVGDPLNVTVRAEPSLFNSTVSLDNTPAAPHSLKVKVKLPPIVKV